jgi:hypothetical protein
MKLLVVSCSLNPGSNSRILAREAERVLQAAGHAVNFLELRELPLPLCDGDAAHGHANVAKIAALFRLSPAVCRDCCSAVSPAGLTQAKPAATLAGLVPKTLTS